MEKNRENCLILLVDPAEDDKIRKDLKENFSLDEAKNIYKELISLAYKKIKHYYNAIPIISYEKTSKNPDLTWLDSDDPGFVEYTKKNLEDRIKDTFKLAFLTGAKKAILIDPLTPDIHPGQFSEALSSINDRTGALGLNEDGSFYLIGITQKNLRILDAPGFTFSKSGEVLYDRMKRSGLAVYEASEKFAVNDPQSLKRWRSGSKMPEDNLREKKSEEKKKR